MSPQRWLSSYIWPVGCCKNWLRCNLWNKYNWHLVMRLHVWCGLWRYAKWSQNKNNLYYLYNLFMAGVLLEYSVSVFSIISIRFGFHKFITKFHSITKTSHCNQPITAVILILNITFHQPTSQLTVLWINTDKREFYRCIFTMMP